MRVLGGTVASLGCFGVEPTRARLRVDTCGQRALRAIPGRIERSTMGQRRAVRRGDSQFRARRCGRLAGDERCAAQTARRAAPGGRWRSVDRRASYARADRRAARGGRAGEARAVRLVDGRVCRVLPARRTFADGVSRAGRDWDQRQPVRRGNRKYPLSSCVGPVGRDARHVGLREGRDGDGVVLFLRCRARGWGGGGERRAGRAVSCRAKEWRSMAANSSLRRW